MKKLLVVDDEPKIRELVSKYAALENFEVYEAEDGFDALSLLEYNDIDILVVDLMMPNLDGFSTVKKIRETSKIPIIMLTARGEDIDKFHGFELGIDDYMVKPFSPKELMYRVHAILNRLQKESQSYELDGLFIDYNSRRVVVDNTSIELALKEYELLLYLVKNKGTALERIQILNKVWGFDFFGDDRTLDTHIKRLRKKLLRFGNNIVTIRGVGYRFDEEI